MMQARVRDRDRVELGQFFLEDQTVLQKIVDSAAIQPNEVVLEIGAGDGRLTKLLAPKAKKVIAIEIDKKLTPVLKDLPKNVEVMIGDGLEFLSQKPLRAFGKIVANLPSALVEPIFYKLTSIYFKLAIFLVPEKFSYKLLSHPVLSAYFDIKLIDKVSKKSFSPMPRTNWEIISVKKVVDPLKSGKTESFLIRYIYEHPQAKLKNSLMEAVLKIFAAKGNKLVKNQARELIKKAKIKKEILENLPTEPSSYKVVSENLIKIISK